MGQVAFDPGGLIVSHGETDATQLLSVVCVAGGAGLLP